MGVFIIELMFTLDGFLALRYFLGIVGISLPVIVLGFLLEQEGQREKEQEFENMRDQEKRMEILQKAKELNLSTWKDDGRRGVDTKSLSNEVDSALTRAEAVEVKAKAPVYSVSRSFPDPSESV